MIRRCGQSLPQLSQVVQRVMLPSDDHTVVKFPVWTDTGYTFASPQSRLAVSVRYITGHFLVTLVVLLLTTS